MGIDSDHDGNTLWQIQYEADGKEEDYDKSDMIKYVIRRESGVSDPDGGISAMLQARARTRETCADNPVEIPTNLGDTPESLRNTPETAEMSQSTQGNVEPHRKNHSSSPEHTDPSTSSDSGGGDTSSTQKSKVFKPEKHKHQDVYVTQLDDSWATVRKNCGVTIDQQREFLRWLQKVHNIGSAKQCKMAEKLGTGMWFKPPIGGKTTRSPWTVPEGTRIPIPSGAEWDEITRKRDIREKELRLDHLSNQAAAAAAFAEECMVNTGKLYFIEEMYDISHSDPHGLDQLDHAYYVDKVVDWGCIAILV